MKKLITIGLLLLLLLTKAYSQNIQTVMQTGHYGAVTAVATSNNGKLIATGSADRTIKLWRASDGKEIRTYSASNANIIQVGFSNDNALLLSVTADGSVSVWNVSDGTLFRTISLNDDAITCATFSPVGNILVTGSKKSGICAWNVADGKEIKNFHAKPMDLNSYKAFDYPEAKTISFSNDGKLIIAGASDKTAIVWDFESGKELGKYKKTRYTCTSCCTEAAITSDNKFIISAASDSVKIFDRVTGKLVRELSNEGGSFNSLCISSDDQLVAAIQHGKAKIWNLKTGEFVREIGSPDKRILTIQFSADNQKLITGNESRTCEVWNISNGKKELTLKGYLNNIDEKLLNYSYMYWASMVNETKLDAQDKYLAIGRTGNNAILFDFQTGRIHKVLEGHSNMVISLCFSNDGKYLATAGLDGKAILWDVESGEMVKAFKYRDSTMAIFSVDISNDNKMLATADWGGNVVIWDIESGNIINVLSPHGGSASYHVKFSPNGIYIISAGLDRKLKMLEIDTGEEIRTFTGHTDLVTSIGFNPDGNKIITSGRDGYIKIWDYLSGLQVMKINAHKGGAFSAKFDDSCKYIVSGGNDNLVKLWDAGSGKLISEFHGHTGTVGDVNITKDHKYIISGSRDGSTRIWDVNSRQELLSLSFLNKNDWFIKNPKGYFDASQGAFNSISFVSGTEIFSADQFFNEFYRPDLYYEVLNNENTGEFRNSIQSTISKFPQAKIEIVSPENETAYDNGIATFMVKVTNTGGGVQELKVMQNGKRLAIDDSDLKRMKKTGQSTFKNFDIDLVPGANEVTVSAVNDGEIESSPQSVTLIYKGLSKTADCYVLGIGINDYENKNLELTYAQPDAKAVTDILNSKGKNLFKNVHSYTLFDKNATKANILRTLDEIAGKIKKEDVFVFFYAGHGSINNGSFYFIPVECSGLYQADKLNKAINANELQDKFKKINALKQVVFIDACHSGSSVDLLAMRGAPEEKALAQLSRSSGIHVMASSESDQESAEIKSLGHGVFTYVLLEALRGMADGAPKDLKVTVYEIKSYIDDQVPEKTFKLIRHKQFPSTFSVGQDFPLVIE